MKTEQVLTKVSDDFQLFMEEEFERIEQSIKAFEVIIDIMDEEQFDLIEKTHSKNRKSDNQAVKVSLNDER